MNHPHAATLVAARSTGRADSVPRRAIRLLVKGPAQLRFPAARWAVSLLAVAGAALLIWSGVIHLQLWSDGYKSIPTIGPLFLLQGIGSILTALLLVVFRRLVLLAGGAVLLAATAAGLLLSVHTGLFGYRESLAVPYAQTSLTVEFTGAALLAVGAIIILVIRTRPEPIR